MSSSLVIGLVVLGLSALFSFIFGIIFGAVYVILRAFLPACVFLETLISDKDANEYMEKHLDERYSNNELDAWYSKREATLFFAMYQLGFAFRRLKKPQARYLDALEDDVVMTYMKKESTKWINRYREENR